jgi:hypothetical protein
METLRALKICMKRKISEIAKTHPFKQAHTSPDSLAVITEAGKHPQESKLSWTPISHLKG